MNFNLNDTYKKIYIEFYDKIFWFCHNKLYDKQDAADCTHDVFIVLIEKHSKIKINNINAWLYKVADNKIKEYNRKHRNYRSINEVDDDIVSISPIDDSESNIIFSEALNSLKPDELKLLNEYIFIGKTDEDLAKELKISPSAVRSRISRIRSKLKCYIFNIK